MVRGTVVKFVEDRHFGFLRLDVPDDRIEGNLFFHGSEVTDDIPAGRGDRFAFEIEVRSDGRYCARRMSRIDDDAPRENGPVRFGAAAR